MNPGHSKYETGVLLRSVGREQLKEALELLKTKTSRHVKRTD